MAIKLLVVTQKVDKDDPVLGFFHRWLELLARECSQLTIICLEAGVYNLPGNVRVLSLGKEKKKSRLHYLINFYKYIWSKRKQYDSVFVHMNPEYAVLAGWWWRLKRKRVIIWYVHRQVSWRLRLALLFVGRVLTVTKESLRFKSKKVVAVGHGIDMEMFNCPSRFLSPEQLNILAVGRIAKIKNLDILIQAGKILSERLDRKIAVNIVGGPVTLHDEDYLKYLKKLTTDLEVESIVRFVGPVPYSQIVSYYCQSDIAVNLCPTGGIDKAVLEAMACGVPVVVANEAFAAYFGSWREKLLVTYNNPDDLAQKIITLAEGGELSELSPFLRRQVEGTHNIRILIKKITNELQ